MRINIRDLLCGLIFLGLGLSFAAGAWLNLRIGRAFEMGPGYFPIVLGALLGALGTAIAIASLGKAGEGSDPIAWRGLFLIGGAVVFFSLVVEPLGLAPALFGATVLAGLATRSATPVEIVALATALTAFCIGVFVYGLGLNQRLLGPWFMG